MLLFDKTFFIKTLDKYAGELKHLDEAILNTGEDLDILHVTEQTLQRARAARIALG